MNNSTIDHQKNVVKKKYTFGQNRWVNFHGSRSFKSFSFSYHTKLTNKYRYRKRITEKPPSPLPGSEEYTNRLISEKSDFIKQQLNLNSPKQSQSITTINNLSVNNSVSEDDNKCDKNGDESKQVIRLTKKKKKSVKSSPVKEYSEEEIYDKVLNVLASLSHDKKKKLINSDASSYDIVCQQTGLKERVIVNRILRDFINQQSENIDGHVNPSVNVEVDALPENLINVLGLDSSALNNIPITRNSHNLALPICTSLKEEVIENDLDSTKVTLQSENNVESIIDGTDKITQSSVGFMLKSLEEILEIDETPVKTKQKSMSRHHKNSASNTKREIVDELNFTEDITLNDAFFKSFGVSLDNNCENTTHEIKDKCDDDTLFEANKELNSNSKTMEIKSKVDATNENNTEYSEISSSPKTNVETTVNAEKLLEKPTLTENNLMNESETTIQQEDKPEPETAKNNSPEQNINSGYTKELLNDINKKNLIVVLPKLTNIGNDSVSLTKCIQDHKDIQNASPKKKNCKKILVPTPKIRIVEGFKKKMPAPKQILLKKSKTIKRAVNIKKVKLKDEFTQTEHDGSSKEIFDRVKKQESKLKTMIKQIKQIDKKMEELNKKRQDLFIKISTFSVLEDVIIATPRRKRKKPESKRPINDESKIKKRRRLSEEAKLIEQALNENENTENVSAQTHDLECEVHLNEELIFKIPLKNTDFNTTDNVGSSLWIIDTEGTPYTDSLNLIESTDSVETTNTITVDENFEVEFKDFTGNIAVIEVYQNKVWVGSTSGFVYAYEILTGQLTETLRVSELPITCIVLTKTTNNFYIGTREPTLNIYSVGDKQLQTITINEGSQCMDFSWDYIFIGSCNGSIMRFNIKNEKTEFYSKISDKSVLAIKATQEGPRRVLLLGLRDSKIYIRDAMSGLPMRSLCDDEEKTIYSLCLSNNIVYCGTNKNDVFCYRFSDGEFITKFHTSSSRSVSFIEKSGNLLFAGCYNSKIYVFDTESNALLNCLDGPDGILLAMKVWNNVIIASTKFHFKAWRIPITLH